MANDKKFINKLTKGLKLKINKKKKSNWKNLNSGGIPRTPTDDSMIYSDTEAELYQAKINVEANRSFSYHNNAYNNESYSNTNNILAALNSNNDKFVNRSKTTYQRPTTNTYTYNSTINSFNNNLGRKPQTTQGNYNIYPSTTTESRKNSLQNVVAASKTTNPQPIQIQYTSSSTNSAPYTTSTTTSPLSLDTSDAFINELNSNNPFKSDINLNANSIHPKATTSQINSQLSIPNTDMAMSHTLISPIEFDVSGNEIKSNNNTNVATSTESNSHKDVNQSKEQKQPSRSKSIKKVKPLITFDKPPVVSPMTVDSEDEENTRGRKRGSRKNKKYSKKRSSPSLKVKTTELRDRSKSVPNFGKRSSYEGKLNSIKPSLVISPTKAKKGNEEDDDIPLGIIQYKCISSILQESAPPNISSLQSNTKKSYKSSNAKDNYGYLSPTEHYPQENKLNKVEPALKINGSLHRRSKSYHTGTHKKRTPAPLTPPLSPKRTEEDEDDENDNIPLYKLLDLDSHDGPMKTMVKPKNLPKLKQKKFRDALDTYTVNVNEDLDLDFDMGFNDIDNTNNNTTSNNNNNNNINNNNNYNNNNITKYHVTSNTVTSPKITITNPFESEFNSLANNNTIVNTSNSNSPSFTTSKAIDIAISRPNQSSNYIFSEDEDESHTNFFTSNMNMNSNQNNFNFINNSINNNNFNNFNNINNIDNNNIFTNFNNSNNFNQFNFNQNTTKVNYNPFLELSNNNINFDNDFRPYSL